jgi:ribosome maturation factor RimP
MTPQPLPQHAFDREALARVVDPVVLAHGAELVDLELTLEQGGWVLRIFIEKAGAAEKSLSTRDAGVDLELCADVSRDLSPALDVADLIPHRYHLEVSSPGVERPLRTERDYARFAGQKAKLRLRDVSGGRRVVEGTLEGASGGVVRVTEGGRTHEVPLGSIERARLVFELTARPKGGKKAKPGRPASGPTGTGD